MDILFDYDVREMKAKIKKIIDDVWDYFFDNTPKYIEIIKSELQEYQGNEELLTSFLDAYEYALRDKDDTSRLDEMIELAQKIITESTDFIHVSNVKDIQAAAYLKKGEYQKARDVLEILPREYDLRDWAFAFRLSGRDKLNGATFSRCHHLQSLYQACMEEGNAWFYMNQHPEVKLHDYTPEDYIPEALKCYQKGLRVLTTFLLNDIYDDPAAQYLWEGMQTFHWCFLQCIAACNKKLGNVEECKKFVTESYRLISVVWKDFEEKKEYYMESFYNHLKDSISLNILNEYHDGVLFLSDTKPGHLHVGIVPWCR